MVAPRSSLLTGIVRCWRPTSISRGLLGTVNDIDWAELPPAGIMVTFVTGIGHLSLTHNPANTFNLVVRHTFRYVRRSQLRSKSWSR
jgi:hypothetical protein